MMEQLKKPSIISGNTVMMSILMCSTFLFCKSTNIFVTFAEIIIL